MNQIIECVPNFSEGRDRSVIDAISNAIKGVQNVALLDVDPGSSTNRTVYTFVGNPESVVEAAITAAKTAFNLIDMRKHKGEHPRLGALDVCPFIPVKGITVEECVQVSKIFGKRLSQELGIPVYLYGSAAVKGDYRITMPQIRAGEYEGLEEKLKNPEWQPDFGSAKFVPSWGATVTGVRKFLIAYNVNVLGTKEQAHRLALNVREQGRGPKEPGRLKHCQAIGWWLEEQNMAQVSINLTDFNETPMHVAYEEICKDAKEINVGISGSEIVGLVPLESILQAADYYIQKEGLMILEEEHKVRLVVQKLGLSSITPFKPKEKIIEYMVEEVVLKDQKSLANLSLKDFTLTVGARTAAPGGGSVAAAVASFGAALATMVGLMTYGKKQWDGVDDKIRSVVPKFHAAMHKTVAMTDADSQAYTDYMEACRRPGNTDEEKKTKEVAMDKAMKNAINVPLTLAREASALWPYVKELAKVGNINTKSDLQVGAKCLKLGVFGAYYNVEINLGSMNDAAFKKEVEKEIHDLLKLAKSECREVLKILKTRKN